VPEPESERWVEARRRMVDDQLVARGVTDSAVLAAMRSIPRHEFVLPGDQDKAYDDGPLAIGEGQTISQPFIVALMSQLAGLTPSSRVLEIGTGCGYQTAVLAACAESVWTIELEPKLSARAARTLAALGIENVRWRVGDGSGGWAEAAPFDAIVVTAAPAEMPPALPEQLAEGGRLVIPIGTGSQDLWLVTRTPAGFDRRKVAPVRFVPLR